MTQRYGYSNHVAGNNIAHSSTAWHKATRKAIANKEKADCSATKCQLNSCFNIALEIKLDCIHDGVKQLGNNI